MPQRPLDNYLKTYRKRAALTQEEVAYLLGSKSGAKVSRYERGRRQPPLETALALAIIFRVPVEELFAGQYQRAERRVRKRAASLTRRLASQKGSKAPRKRAVLAALSSPRR